MSKSAFKNLYLNVNGHNNRIVVYKDSAKSKYNFLTFSKIMDVIKGAIYKILQKVVIGLLR